MKPAILTIEQRLQTVREQISSAEQHFERPAGSVQLLAVSKTRPAEDILDVFVREDSCQFIW